MTEVMQDRRSQLLDLAAPLMATRGFHGMSVGDLGAAAGITAPALYRHFPSKQALLGALLTDISERLLAGRRGLRRRGVRSRRTRSSGWSAGTSTSR